ncbi:hypothetical protein [Peribacillus kribbensis]|nr:hypothetical protein [Peribacillus kribbensis]
MNLLENFSERQFKQILINAYKKELESGNIKLAEFIEDIKQQILNIQDK